MGSGSAPAGGQTRRSPKSPAGGETVTWRLPASSGAVATTCTWTAPAGGSTTGDSRVSSSMPEQQASVAARSASSTKGVPGRCHLVVPAARALEGIRRETDMPVLAVVEQALPGDRDAGGIGLRDRA